MKLWFTGLTGQKIERAGEKSVKKRQPHKMTLQTHAKCCCSPEILKLFLLRTFLLNLDVCYKNILCGDKLLQKYFPNLGSFLVKLLLLPFVNLNVFLSKFLALIAYRYP